MSVTRDRSVALRSASPARIFARLNPGIALHSGADGKLAAICDGEPIRLGIFSSRSLDRIGELDIGLQIDGSGPGDAEVEAELRELVRQLALFNLVEYRLARGAQEADLVVIEPQLRDYAPRLINLDDDRGLVLSRFAYLRRRGVDLVLESPLSGALFRICDVQIAVTIASLSEPRTARQLSEQHGFPGIELLGLLVDCQILFTPGPGSGKSLRAAEGDDSLILWDFHDLLFHARSTVGRHANPSGGCHAFEDLVAPLPAVRPPWPGSAIELDVFGPLPPQPAIPLRELLRKRHSTRRFDAQNPITVAELGWLLEGTARIISIRQLHDAEDEGPPAEIAARPYPSGGASYELELYVAVDRCEGLPHGFYYYDAARHALVPIGAHDWQLKKMLANSQRAMGSSGAPQVLVTIAARFGRVSWKYSGFAYALVQKNAGVLMQTIYLMATEMDLGACAIGVADIELFGHMTDIKFHIEGSVGQIAIGRGVDEEPAADD